MIEVTKVVTKVINYSKGTKNAWNPLIVKKTISVIIVANFQNILISTWNSHMVQTVTVINVGETSQT
jgi:hypothetical protein